MQIDRTCDHLREFLTTIEHVITCVGSSRSGSELESNSLSMEDAMWKALVLGGLAATLLFVGVSRSDVGDPDALATDSSFPLPAPAADPVAPAPPGSPPARELFTPYDTGPPEATWRYEDLTPAEKETADLGRDVSGWSASQDAMVAAVREQGRIEAAKIAQRQLGLGQLGDTGVVP